MFSDRQRQTPEQPSLPSNEIVVQASKKGEDERGAMGGRRSRPLRSVGNTHWKETHVYMTASMTQKAGCRTPLRRSHSLSLSCQAPWWRYEQKDLSSLSPLFSKISNHHKTLMILDEKWTKGNVLMSFAATFMKCWRQTKGKCRWTSLYWRKTLPPY